MLRRLVLLRHAKASPAEYGESDHERPLSEKGLIDAHEIGKRLRKKGYVPEHVLCSDSRRTKETWARVASEIGVEASYVESRSLYESSAKAYLDVVEADGFNGTALLIVGHNPTIEILAARLAGQEFHVQPGDAIILEADAPSWKEALDHPGSWSLVEHLRC